MPASWSRLVRFVAVEDGAIHWGEPEDGGDVGLAYEEGRRIRARLLASGDPLVGDGSLADGPSLTVARLLAPVPQATMGTTMVRVLGLYAVKRDLPHRQFLLALPSRIARADS